MVPIERYPVGKDERRLGIFYFDQIKRSDVQVLLNANVTAINPNPDGKRIQDVTVQTLAGNRFSVRARAFVLATGGIENARLLLLPTKINEAGIGNNHDLVGRNFSEHLFSRGKLMETNSPWQSDGETFSVLPPQLQDKFALPELGILRRFRNIDNKTGDSIISAMSRLTDGSAEARIAQLVYYIEVLPTPENRVVLSSARDAFGEPEERAAV